MARIHAFDHDAPASSPQDQFNDILIRAAHGVTFGSHTAAHPQMLQDAGKNLVVAFKSCCRLKIRPVDTKLNLANFFTKLLDLENFTRLRSMMMVDRPIDLALRARL